MRQMGRDGQLDLGTQGRNVGFSSKRKEGRT